jgi:hypothetical protein
MQSNADVVDDGVGFVMVIRKWICERDGTKLRANTRSGGGRVGGDSENGTKHDDLFTIDCLDRSSTGCFCQNSTHMSHFSKLTTVVFHNSQFLRLLIR